MRIINNKRLWKSKNEKKREKAAKEAADLKMITETSSIDHRYDKIRKLIKLN